MENLEKIAFDLLPVGIVLTEQRVIKSCNRTFAAMFGYDGAELLEQSFRILYPSRSDFEAIRDVGLEPLRQTGRYSDERIMQHKDGSVFWVRVRVATPNPNDPLSLAVFSFADISEQRPEVELTAREKQVVLRLGQGRTSKEIARDLSLSPRTIDDYRSRLLAKFDARNVTELLSRLSGIG